MNADDLQAVWLTLKLASLSTLILLFLGTPLAWWLARTQRSAKVIVEACVALPLVLPPTVLGFYLLVALGPNGPIGSLTESLAFSFSGLLIGSVIYSLPFVVQPLQTAFTGIPNRTLEVAATLRADSRDRFFSVVLPQTRHAYLGATVLGFAHTLGEFGVVLMIGGNIPGETQVLSIAIYEHVEALDYASAHILSGGLLLAALLMLMLVYTANRQRPGSPQ